MISWLIAIGVQLKKVRCTSRRTNSSIAHSIGGCVGADGCPKIGVSRAATTVCARSMTAIGTASTACSGLTAVADGMVGGCHRM
ncbi:hypothetical protein MPHL21000_11060 [Mycolicibacterium phlei DSM 43239 = CCUG 21000]|uniref:Uncharacterized protein n=1 Tax=Mycolicibacterium phlei DSM 43239 = CCUG 21000 TaxID=1226750 RepID=A0A5N5V463_MYCPH|nr:hypothetical protein [Mycolicibacterium phlei]KAB7756733.1 hypothetical protein MPHL21000_11060 [Mycolicibacterium phlei DSM 43239 = CCUG 21000]